MDLRTPKKISVGKHMQSNLLLAFETSHKQFHFKLDLPDHTHAVLLMKAQSYLFLKSKSCGSCAARRVGLFSPFLECIFSSPFVLSLPLCVSFGFFPPSPFFKNFVYQAYKDYNNSVRAK